MKKILKYFIYLCLPFVLFDVYSHIRTYYSSNLKAQSYYQTNTFYWNYLPNVSFSVTNEDGEKVTIQSDKLGFRNARSEAKADFMLLGDSFVNAANTPLEATYAQALVNKGLSVYNAAVDGTGTCHQAYILNDYIEKVQPKVVVLHFYLGNDFRDNFLGPGLEELEYAHEKKEKPVGSKATPISSPDLSLKSKLRPIKNFLSDKSPSIKLICDSVSNVQSQANNMSAYDRGEIMVLAFDENQPDPDTSIALKNTEKAIESILKVIHTYNQKHQASVRLVVVGIPSKAQVLLSIREITGYETDKGANAFLQPFVKKIDFNNPDKLLAKICSEFQVPYFSLLKPFREHISEAFYYNFDSHWNRRGQQFAASLVSQWLIEGKFAGSATLNSEPIKSYNRLKGEDMRYIWQHSDWPNFQYDLTKVQDLLYQYALETGALSAQFDKSSERDALIEFMVSEAINTSKIEGEILDQEDVRSSIFNQLGISEISHKLKDPRAIGIAQLMISVRETFNEPLSEEQLFDWHKMVMSQPSHDFSLEIGKWRTSKEPMQVVSGPIGNQRVHFEAPPSSQVPKEMKRFIRWFNESHPVTGTIKISGSVRAAIAHLYFESIHPFADGNGRVGRAISEKALSQELQRPVAFSLSSAIYKNRRQYYQELTDASRGDMNITPWVIYFVNTVYEAQMMAKTQVIFVLQKAQFWNRFGSKINDRQTRVVQRIFQAGVDGFEGGISAQKYMKIADCSKATATRDLTDLFRKGCLAPFPESGRSTRYSLVLE